MCNVGVWCSYSALFVTKLFKTCGRAMSGRSIVYILICCAAGFEITGLTRTVYKVNWAPWSTGIGAVNVPSCCSFWIVLDLNRWVENSGKSYLEFVWSLTGETWLQGSAILLDKKLFHFRSLGPIPCLNYWTLGVAWRILGDSSWTRMFVMRPPSIEVRR